MNTPKDKTARLFIRFACAAMLVFMMLCTASCGSANSDTDTEIIPSLYEIASKSTTASYKPEAAEPQVSEVMQTYTSDRVMSILESTEGLSEISSFTDTQGNNPNGLHSVIYFKSQYPAYTPNSDITFESASYGGGCIEIYKDSDNANKRCEYLSSPEGKAVSPCLFTKLDNLVIRISEYLTVYNAVKLEAELLSALDPDADTVSSDFVPVTDAPLTTEEVATQTVWISGSGSKYHSKATCSGMKSPSQITLAEAEKRGFTPCKRCH